MVIISLLLSFSVSDVNMGRLLRGDLGRGFGPPVASAIVDLLEKHGEILKLS